MTCWEAKSWTSDLSGIVYETSEFILFVFAMATTGKWATTIAVIYDKFYVDNFVCPMNCNDTINI